MHGPHYESWLNEEERKLRWLILRLPGSMELQYYLVFLLAANQRHMKALRECERMLAADPDNFVARWWIHSLQGKRPSDLPRRSAHRWRRRTHERSWNQSGCGDH